MIIKIVFLRIYEIIVAERVDQPVPEPGAPPGMEIEIVKDDKL